MRDKILYGFGIAAALLLVRNLYLIFLVMPDEASQGMVYRLLYFHVPAWWTALPAVGVSALMSVLFLITARCATTPSA
jgi:heme exporter protein C